MIITECKKKKQNRIKKSKQIDNWVISINYWDKILPLNKVRCFVIKQNQSNKQNHENVFSGPIDR